MKYRLTASVIKPNICYMKNIDTKPCEIDSQPCDSEFRTDHEMIVTISTVDKDNNDSKLVSALHCVVVNMKDDDDVKEILKSNYKDVMDNILSIDTKYPIDNLIIVHDIWFSRWASIKDINRMFERLHCILCRAASSAFCRGYNPGIYFDLTKMQKESAEILEKFIREYNDGDMRKKTYNNGIYIHKIFMEYHCENEQ